MGLTWTSVGKRAGEGDAILHRTPDARIVALAGNPNVGKSTLFNALTGMNQHTGNWPGKTVSLAQGTFSSPRHAVTLVDLPGTYSLIAHSAEEAVARDFLCFEEPDATVVVCDATCLERNLHLVLQILEVCDRVLVCVNLMDEARRKGITVDTPRLSALLGVPVIGCVARKKRSLTTLGKALDSLWEKKPTPVLTDYGTTVESAVETVREALPSALPRARWLSLKLLEGDPVLCDTILNTLPLSPHEKARVADAVTLAQRRLADNGMGGEALVEHLVSCAIQRAEAIGTTVVSHTRSCREAFDERVDRILTGRRFGYPLMLLLLLFIFWLTIGAANYPSRLLWGLFFHIQDALSSLFLWLDAPAWLHDALVLGVWRTLAWVVAVMLPPMAIFFPLFTLLEDVGYLPRIAYNLDRPFQRCRACGKQALTMCMGLGCNAAGVVGCRIIDSPRERMIAMLTNVFMPCNGRFPTLITLITLFFIGNATGLVSSLLSALLLTALILVGLIMTFLISRWLSGTLLRGVPSAFTLELPPYRPPQIGRILIRSIFDRTLFVLGRAAAVAAPTGLVIWVMANVQLGGASLLAHCAACLDPFATLMGLDGVILVAFLLGLPANEIVLPLILMAYLCEGTLVDATSTEAIKSILLANGWTGLTALNVMLFSLMHWPCSTTLLTIKKESGSLKWTFLAFLIPTLCGIAVCMLTTALARLFT